MSHRPPDSRSMQTNLHAIVTGQESVNGSHYRPFRENAAPAQDIRDTSHSCRTLVQQKSKPTCTDCHKYLVSIFDMYDELPLHGLLGDTSQILKAFFGLGMLTVGIVATVARNGLGVDGL